MGLNFYCACHRCRESMCVSRGDEHQGLFSFWDEHRRCARRDKDALVVVADGYTEQPWMYDEALGYSQSYFTADPPDERTVGRAERWHMGWRLPNQ